jgi:hypothetical protein
MFDVEISEPRRVVLIPIRDDLAEADCAQPSASGVLQKLIMRETFWRCIQQGLQTRPLSGG